MAERTIRLTIEYDGTGFSGWQVQPRQRTIQGEMEEALKKIIGIDTNLIAAGRTDAGVHALGQVAHFKTETDLEAKKFADALNYYLPEDILVCGAEEAAPGFHARYDAVWRCYRYDIKLSRSAVGRSGNWTIEFPLRLDSLDWAADYIEGEHDFSSFCVVSSQKYDNRCLVYLSRWQKKGNALSYEITANRFLHTMIRSLVGLMVELGRGGINKSEFKKIFTSGDHTQIRRVAPARGLCLVAVEY